jgi:hypothetical protein
MKATVVVVMMVVTVAVVMMKVLMHTSQVVQLVLLVGRRVTQHTSLQPCQAARAC